MSIAEPIPDVQFGKGAWLDYVSNWRQKDAGYLQERSILRYASVASRAIDWATPRAGQVTYRADADRLEMYSTLRSAWINVLLFQFLTSSKDDASGVTISHTGAAGKGATFGPSSVVVDLPLNVYNGLLTADATGVGVKTTAMKQALLTTNATELLSDTALAAPSLRLSGTGTVLNAAGKAVTVGALTADSATIPNISLTGTLSGGGVLNGASGTIGGVAMSANRATASAGFLAQAGLFSGDGSSAVMRANGGGPYLQISTAGGVYSGGGQFDFYNTVRLLNGNVLVYYNSSNSVAVNVAPSLYSAGDPGAANFPDGTIWVS